MCTCLSPLEHAASSAQDEVVKLKGHESLTKLLIWYSENEPKPDPPDQPPPKTPYEMRVTTHLKTACTIANVLGHAILSEPAVRFPVSCIGSKDVLCMVEWERGSLAWEVERVDKQLGGPGRDWVEAVNAESAQWGFGQ